MIQKNNTRIFLSDQNSVYPLVPQPDTFKSSQIATVNTSNHICKSGYLEARRAERSLGAFFITVSFETVSNHLSPLRLKQLASEIVTEHFTVLASATGIVPFVDPNAFRNPNLYSNFSEPKCGVSI